MPETKVLPPQEVAFYHASAERLAALVAASPDNPPVAERSEVIVLRLTTSHELLRAERDAATQRAETAEREWTAVWQRLQDALTAWQADDPASAALAVERDAALAQVAALREVLALPEHGVNDDNCPTPWYGRDGCEACDGDKKRTAALAQLEVKHE